MPALSIYLATTKAGNLAPNSSMQPTSPCFATKLSSKGSWLGCFLVASLYRLGSGQILSSSPMQRQDKLNHAEGPFTSGLGMIACPEWCSLRFFPDHANQRSPFPNRSFLKGNPLPRLVAGRESQTLEFVSFTAQNDRTMFGRWRSISN